MGEALDLDLPQWPVAGMNPLYANLPTTIFEAMSARARATGAINLGQGFPDSGWPEDVLEAAATALTRGNNQYPPMPGTPELRRAIADHYRAHQDVDLDWHGEVTVTSGATEALAAALLALITPGDEVILFQPLYDAYLPLVRRAGGVPVLVPLAPPHWQFDAAMLEAAFTPRTRVVLLNNPKVGTYGAGSEAANALAPSAIAAAIHDATGKTLRRLPFKPASVLELLKS